MSSLEQYQDIWHLDTPIQVAKTATSTIFQVNYMSKPAILKLLTKIGRKVEATGSLALGHFNGKGAVKLLKADLGAHLLEYADRETLKKIFVTQGDRVATNIACEVLQNLHDQQPPNNFYIPSLADHFQSLIRRAKTEPQNSLFAKTALIANRLIKSQSSLALLHGDIHHTNIINSSHRGWLAIDPQCIIGERTYDTANFFYNPDDQPDLVESEEHIMRTASIFSERLNVDKLRILQFAYAHGGLSASWQLDDGGNPKRRLKIATKIGELLKQL